MRISLAAGRENGRRAHRLAFGTVLLFVVALLSVPSAYAQKGTVRVIDAGDGGIALDVSTGNLYVADGAQIKVFDPSGSLLFEFGEAGSGGGQLGMSGSTGVSGIAINQETGDVYVADRINNRVQQFDATGGFIRAWGRDVNATLSDTGFEICTAASGDQCKPGTFGSEPGQFLQSSGSISGHGFGIAVGPDGRVFTAEPGNRISAFNQAVKGNRRVEIFSSTGAYLSQFHVPSDPSDACGVNFACTDVLDPRVLAIDSDGTIYTAPRPASEISSTTTMLVKRFASNGTLLGQFAPASVSNYRPTAVTVNSANDRIFVYQLNQNRVQYQVAEYDQQGNSIELWGLGIPGDGNVASGIYDLAVDPVRNRVYVSDGNDRVLVLDDLLTLPEATIEPVAEIVSDGALFKGTANSNTPDLGAGYHFEYRASGESSWIAAPKTDVGVGAGTTPVAASHAITGLVPNTEYEARLVVTRELGGGFDVSPQVTFTTDPEPPAIGQPTATKILDTSARLQAALDPRHSETSYYFEYGLDETYGSFSPASQDGEGGDQFGPKLIAEDLEGLQPGTTYHYRLIAANQAGSVSSDDRVFTTRTPQELDWPARGIELVNPPDKGNQLISRLESGLSPLSPDGGRLLWTVAGGTPGGTAGAKGAYIATRTPSGWTSKSVIPPAAQQAGGGDYYYEPLAVAANFSAFVFEAKSGFFEPTLPTTAVWGDESGAQHVIAEDIPGGQPDRTVIADDGRAVFRDPVGGELTLFKPDGSRQVLPTPSCGYTLPDPVFSYSSWFDGVSNRVFYYSPGDGDCGAPPALYMLDLDEAAPTPTQLSGAQSAPVTLLRVGRGGEGLLFIKGGDLHRWSGAGGAECLTCGSGREIEGDAVVSPDLSHVYFCEDIASPAPGVLKACDLYVWSAEHLRLIGTVSGAAAYSLPDDRSMDSTSAVSADGETFFFLTPLSPTAEGTGWNPSSSGDFQEFRFMQMFVYEDSTGAVECLSCHGTAADVAVAPGIASSADGETVAFAAKTGLVEEDINGAWDVYEWHNGLLRLITDGESEVTEGNSRPRVWGSSTDGRVVAFTAGGSRITGHERDNFSNAYVARVGGAGFPVEQPPAHCVEDSCQGPLQSSPSLPAAASAALRSAGNSSPAATKRRRCARLKVRRGSRCVPRKKKRTKPQRRSTHQRRRAAR